MDNALANSLVTFDVNGVPLSLSMVIGMPKRGITSFDSLFTTVFASSLAHAKTSGHFENLSTIVNMYFRFPTAGI